MINVLAHRGPTPTVLSSTAENLQLTCPTGWQHGHWDHSSQQPGKQSEGHFKGPCFEVVILNCRFFGWEPSG